MMTYKRRDTIQLFAPLVAVIVIVIFAAVGFFASPVSDDFSHVAKKWSLRGLFDEVRWYYFSHGGLYAATTFRFTHATLTNLAGYWLVAPVVLLSHAFAFYWLLRLFISRRASSHSAAMLLAAFLVQMPNVGEYLYWATGALVYATGTFMMLITLRIGIARVYCGDRDNPSVVEMTVLVVVFPLMVGTHWPFAFWALLWSFILTCQSIRISLPSRGFWFALFIITLIFFVIVILAPGNLARAGGVESALDLSLRDLSKSGASLFEYLYSFVFNIPVLSVSVYIATHCILSDDPRATTCDATLGATITLAAWFVVCAAVFGISALAGLHPPVLRTLNALFLGTLAMWMISFMVSIQYYGDAVRRSVAVEAIRFVQTLAAVVFLLSILLGGHFRTAMVDLLKWGPIVEDERSLRIQHLREAAASGSTCVSLSPTKYYLKLFTPYDGYGEHEWIHKLAPLYGLKKVVLDGYGECP